MAYKEIFNTLNYYSYNTNDKCGISDNSNTHNKITISKS